MKSIVVTQADMDNIEAILEEHEKQGLKVGAVSDCGLQKGEMRITFLPKEAFKKPDDMEAK